MVDLKAQRSAAGGGVVLVLRFAVTAVMNYGFGVVLLWLLPASEFGAVGVLQNVLLLLAVLLSAGFPWVLARRVAQAGGAATGSAAGTLRAAVLGNLALGLALAGGIGVLQTTDARLIPSASRLLPVVLALTGVLLAVNAVLAGALQGARRFDALGLLLTSEIGAKVIVGLGLAALFGLGVEGVAVGFLVGAAVATCWAVAATRDLLPPLTGPVDFGASRLALPFAVGTSCFGVLSTLDVLCLLALGRGHGVTAATLAAYQAALILARAPFYVADAFADAVFPYMAAAPTPADRQAWLGQALKWVRLVLLPIQLVLLVAPGSVVDLVFPGRYHDVVGLVRLLNAGTLGLLLAVIYLKALYAAGDGWPVARSTAAGVAVQLTGLVVLVPRYGAVGAGWATCLGAWTAAVELMRSYDRDHAVPRPTFASLARWAVPVDGLLLCLIGAMLLPQPLAALAAAVGLLGWVAGAWAVGLLTTADLVRARGMLPTRGTPVTQAPVTQAAAARAPAPPTAPAIGPVGRASRRGQVARLVAVAALVVALVVAKLLVVDARTPSAALPPLPGAARVSPQLLRGSQPADADLSLLAQQSGVRAVVNVGAQSVEERAVATSLHLGYLESPLDPEAAPTWQQLATMAQFVGMFARQGQVVYLHDDTGGPRALVTSQLLRVVRGDPPQEVLGRMGQEQWATLSAAQAHELIEVSGRLTAGAVGGTGPYADVRVIPW